MQVTKSDIDQMVLGYVAEERYIGTRDKLFEESPNLPEKVQILPLFGDISSERRLHTILQEYVELKIKQQTSSCPLCNTCNSLSDLFRILHQVADKIENFQTSALSSQSLQSPTSSSTPDVHRLSPSVISRERREKSSKKSPNASRRTVPGLEKEMGLPFHRKQFNPVTQLFETVLDEANTSVAGSSKRKKTSMPKRLNCMQQQTEDLTYNGDLSKLFHTTDKTDALALVGVKILSNIKKCAVNGSTADSINNMELSTALPRVSPVKTSYGPSLDIDDLISDETRGGLIEMTIDSLLNSDGNVDVEQQSSLKNFDEDLGELRRLLEFEDSNMSNLTLPDVIQTRQDERYLMDIIKDDEDVIPENPTVELSNQLTNIDNSLKISSHSPDEKQALAGLLAIQCSHNSNTSRNSDVELTANRTDANTIDKNNGDLFELPSVIEHDSESQNSVLPKIINTFTQSNNQSDDMIDTHDGNPNKTPLKSGEVSYNLSNNITSNCELTIDERPIDFVALSEPDNLTENCVSVPQDDITSKTSSTMPPKKRFLAKESSTPEKPQSSTKPVELLNVSLTNPHFDSVNQTKKHLDFQIQNPNHGTLVTLRSPDVILAAAALANVETTLPTNKSTDARADNDKVTAHHPSQSDANGDEKESYSGTSQSQLRRSKRQKKTNFSLKDVVGKRKPDFRSRKNDSVHPKDKENFHSKSPVKNASKKKSLMSVIGERPKATSDQLPILNTEKGAVTFKLKDKGRTPLLVKGILVQPNEEKLSQQDIIGRLVGQMQKEAPKKKSLLKDNANPGQFTPEAGQSKSSCSNVNENVKSIVVNEVPLKFSNFESPHVPQGSLPSEVLPPLPLNGSFMSQISSVGQPNVPASEEQISSQSVENVLTIDLSSLTSSSYHVSGTGGNLLYTPEKNTNNNFSTISPSAGIFSVIDNNENEVEKTTQSQFKNQLVAAKSNLTRLFANSEPVIAQHVTEAQQNITTNHKTTLFDLSTVNDDYANVNQCDSSTSTRTNTNLTSTGLLVPTDSGVRVMKQMEPQICVRKRAAKAQVKEKKSKFQGVKKHSIYMCNNKKDMVRIEPKRSAKVAAVKRSILPLDQKETSDKSAPNQSIMEPENQPQSKSSSCENIIQNHVENTVHDHPTEIHTSKDGITNYGESQAGNNYDINGILEDETTSAIHKRDVKEVSVTNPDLEHFNKISSESTHLSENNCNPLEKLVQSAELDYRASQAYELMQPEVQLIDVNLLSSGHFFSKTSRVETIGGVTTKSSSLKCPQSGGKVNDTINTKFQTADTEKKKLKRKNKSHLHGKHKKRKIKSSPLMKLSHAEIDAKLDTVHGRKSGKEASNKSSPETMNQSSNGDQTVLVEDKIYDIQLLNQEKSLHKQDETRSLILEMEPLDFSLSSWANSDTMQKFLTDSPFKVPGNIQRNLTSDELKSTNSSNNESTKSSELESTRQVVVAITPIASDKLTTTSVLDTQTPGTLGQILHTENKKQNHYLSAKEECSKNDLAESNVSNPDYEKKNSKRNKKKRRSNEKHKRKIKRNSFKTLSYEEIQAKLDAVHGKKECQNENLKSNETIEISTENQVQNKIEKSSKKVNLDTQPNSIKMNNQRKDVVQSNFSNDEEEKNARSIEFTSDQMNYEEQNSNSFDASSTQVQINDASFIKSEAVSNCNTINSSLSTQILSAKKKIKCSPTSVLDSQHGEVKHKQQDTRKMTYEVEPLDLSLSSWTNSKSPQKILKENLVGENQRKDVEKCPEFRMQNSDHDHQTVLSTKKEYNPNTCNHNIFEKKKKSHSRENDKISSKISKKRKKSSKLKLKDIDISKFLDTLDYGECQQQS